jgi:hypothetical protein
MPKANERYFGTGGRTIQLRMPLEVLRKYKDLQSKIGANLDRRFKIEGRVNASHNFVLNALILYVARIVEFQGEHADHWLENEIGPIYDQLDTLARSYIATYEEDRLKEKQEKSAAREEPPTKKAAGEKAASRKGGAQPGTINRPGAEDDPGLTIEEEHPHFETASRPKSRRRSNR